MVSTNQVRKFCENIFCSSLIYTILFKKTYLRLKITIKMNHKICFNADWAK